jgi:drug/metabolite transporter (DMT)-like permease
VAEPVKGSVPPARGGFALLNGCVIAGYTVVDGTGVRRSGHALGYTCWVFALNALPLATFLFLSRGRVVLAHARARWLAGALGGVLSVLAYGLVLWAMTRAPIPAVAAVRETSVVFGTLLGTWQLREPLAARRVAAAGLVAAGVLVEQLGQG